MKLSIALAALVLLSTTIKAESTVTVDETSAVPTATVETTKKEEPKEVAIEDIVPGPLSEIKTANTSDAKIEFKKDDEAKAEVKIKPELNQKNKITEESKPETKQTEPKTEEHEVFLDQLAKEVKPSSHHKSHSNATYATIKHKSPSPSERLKKYREQLEERNVDMVQKKMEYIRYQQELALMKQLEKTMNNTLKAIDNIK